MWFGFLLRFATFLAEMVRCVGFEWAVIIRVFSAIISQLLRWFVVDSYSLD